MPVDLYACLFRRSIQRSISSIVLERARKIYNCRFARCVQSQHNRQACACIEWECDGGGQAVAEKKRETKQKKYNWKMFILSSNVYIECIVNYAWLHQMISHIRIGSCVYARVCAAMQTAVCIMNSFRCYAHAVPAAQKLFYFQFIFVSNFLLYFFSSLQIWDVTAFLCGFQAQMQFLTAEQRNRQIVLTATQRLGEYV